MARKYRRRAARSWHRAFAAPRPRLAATVDLPTPPFPAATRTTFLTVGNKSVCPAPDLLPRTWAPKFISRPVMPGTAPKAFLQSVSMVSRSGQAGVVNSTVKRTLPLSMARSLTIPRLTISRCSSGSWTLRNAAMICSCEIFSTNFLSTRKNYRLIRSMRSMTRLDIQSKLAVGFGESFTSRGKSLAVPCAFAALC